MQHDDWLSTAALADWLHIPTGTIYRWRYQGIGPIGYRVGRHIRFRLVDVEEWLNEQRDEREPAGVTRTSGPIR